MLTRFKLDTQPVFDLFHYGSELNRLRNLQKYLDRFAARLALLGEHMGQIDVALVSDYHIGHNHILQLLPYLLAVQPQVKLGYLLIQKQKGPLGQLFRLHIEVAALGTGLLQGIEQRPLDPPGVVEIAARLLNNGVHPLEPEAWNLAQPERTFPQQLHTTRPEVLIDLHGRGMLAGWRTIPAEVVDVDDARAIVIATSTNLIQRQGLSIIERGFAYKALLDAKNQQGYRSDMQSLTSGENRQKYSARALVAEFFSVTEYEIRKAVKLTQLIPKLADILENNPKQLNLACADLIADYDAESQEAFIEICSIEGYQINKAAMQHIVRKCPPPAADRQSVFAAWREARDAAEKRLTAPPRKISFDRKQFVPYLDKFGSDREIEKLFLEFLQERAKVS